jgi:hypothetical protein
MWWFVGEIFMKNLSGSKNNNLMLTGVFTFALSGSAVGHWVDSTACLRGKLPFVEYNKIVKGIYT